jgi:O-methyltransferase domain
VNPFSIARDGTGGGSLGDLYSRWQARRVSRAHDRVSNVCQGAWAKEPTSLYENPYSDYFNASNTGLTTWDITPKDPDRRYTFQVGLDLADSMVPTIGCFDFEALAVADGEDRLALVDVGEGIGNKLNEILRASPKLRPETTMLQDQPRTIEMAKKESPAPKTIQMMEHDFWKEPVKGKDNVQEKCLFPRARLI